MIAWALYVLLKPVNPAVSLLAALFRLIYTAVALAGMLNLVTVYRMLTAPEYATAFGSGQLHAQVNLLLNTLQYDWSMSLVIFGLHLLLVGALIYKSGYMPKWLGAILVVDAFCVMILQLRPYLWPNAHVGFLFFGMFGELVLMLWLLIVGWREPVALQPATADTEFASRD